MEHSNTQSVTLPKQFVIHVDFLSQLAVWTSLTSLPSSACETAFRVKSLLILDVVPLQESHLEN